MTCMGIGIVLEELFWGFTLLYVGNDVLFDTICNALGRLGWNSLALSFATDADPAGSSSNRPLWYGAV
jgi:hypothetical protein